MKKRKGKQIISFLLAVFLLLGEEPVSALAAGIVKSEQYGTFMEVSEENGSPITDVSEGNGNPITDVSEGNGNPTTDVSEGDGPAWDVSDGNSSEINVTDTDDQDDPALWLTDVSVSVTGAFQPGGKPSDIIVETTTPDAFIGEVTYEAYLCGYKQFVSGSTQTFKSRYDYKMTIKVTSSTKFFPEDVERVVTVNGKNTEDYYIKNGELYIERWYDAADKRKNIVLNVAPPVAGEVLKAEVSFSEQVYKQEYSKEAFYETEGEVAETGNVYSLHVTMKLQNSQEYFASADELCAYVNEGNEAWEPRSVKINRIGYNEAELIIRMRPVKRYAVTVEGGEALDERGRVIRNAIEGQTIVLSAFPSADQKFAGWEGIEDCTSAGNFHGEYQALDREMSIVATLTQPALYMPKGELSARATYGEITDNFIYGVELSTTDFYAKSPIANCFVTNDPYYKVKEVEWYRITGDNKLEAVTGRLDAKDEYYAKIKLVETEAGGAAGKQFTQRGEKTDTAKMRWVCGSVNGRPVLKSARGAEQGIITPYMLCYMGRPAYRLVMQDGAKAYNADQVGIDSAMEGEMVTLTAPAEKEGKKFSRWIFYTLYEGRRDANIALSEVTDEINGALSDTEISFAMPAYNLEIVPVYAEEDKMISELTISGIERPEAGKHLYDMPAFTVSGENEMIYAGWGIFPEEGASLTEELEILSEENDVAEYGTHYICMIGVKLKEGYYFTDGPLTVKGMQGEPILVYNGGTFVTLLYDFGYLCPQGIWVRQIEPQIYTGQAVKPSVEVFCEGIRLKENTDYSISYRNNTKAADASDKNAPTVVITGKKNYKGKVTAAFTITPADFSSTPGITAEEVTVIYSGKKIWGKPVVKYDGRTVPASEYTLEYLHAADADAFCKPGNYTIKITGNGKNFTGSMTCTQRITAKLTDKNIKMGKVEAVYTGGPIGLQSDQYAVQSADGKNSLKKGVDYEIRYRNNVEAGTATAEFVGIGCYSGTVKKTFKIAQKELYYGMVINMPVACPYSSNGVFPTGYEVKDNTFTMTEGVDYTVKHRNNKAVADKEDAKAPTIQITGKGNYKGTINITYSIVPLELEEALDGGKNIDISCVYYKDAKNNYKPQYTLTDTTGKKLTEKRDFTTEYYYLDEETYMVLPVTGDRVKMPDGRSSISMMVTFTGVGNYTGTIDSPYYLFGKQMKDVAVEKIPNMVYTGEPVYVYPELKDKKTGFVLQDGMEYISLYRNNVDAGTATVTLKGNYLYIGEITKTFKIEKAVLGIQNADKTTTPGSHVQIEEFPAAYTYTGEAIKPTDFKVTYYGKELTAGKDFTVSYQNNTKASVGAASGKEPKVVLTGKGNFTGKLELPFTILPADIGTCTIEAKDILYKDTKNNYKVLPVLTNTEGKKLKAGTDYEKECLYYTEDAYGNQTPVSAEKIHIGSEKEIVMAVTVTGKGNYQGSSQTVYRIYRNDVKSATVSKIENQIYTGGELTPKVTVTFGKEKKLLQENTDYILRYENNESTGTATVYIIGMGEYGGEKKVTFRILPHEMTWWEEFFYTASTLFT